MVQRAVAARAENTPPEGQPLRKRKRRRRRPRPRTNLGPPKTIEIDGSGMPGGRPVRRRRPPPRQLKEDSFLDVVRTVIGILPGLRDMTETGFKPPPDDGPIPSGRPKGPPPPGVSTYGEWASDIELGDDWAFRPGADYPAPPEDTRPRYPNSNTPRDSYLKPIADPIGIVDRLSFDRRSREERIAEEALLNSRESRAAVTFAGVWLFLLPFGLGYFVSRGLAEPVIVFVQETNPERFQLSSKMKREGTQAIKKEALRLRMESQIGKAPPLTDEEVYVRCPPHVSYQATRGVGHCALLVQQRLFGPHRPSQCMRLVRPPTKTHATRLLCCAAHAAAHSKRVRA